MNSTRRTFIKNSLGLVATGVAMPSLLKASSAASAKVTGEQLQNNLLDQGVYLGGSSFYGTVNHSTLTIDTDNYYPEVLNDNPEKGWTPMEAKGPHWLEMRWRYPVKINRFRWSGKNFTSCHLEAYQHGTFVQVQALQGEQGNAAFPEITTNRLRINVIDFAGKPVINELEVTGPNQAIAPSVFPEKTLPQIKFLTDNAKTNKSTFKPLEDINITFEASVNQVIDSDCYFILEIREKAPNDYFRNYFGDFIVSGTAVMPEKPTSTWKAKEKNLLNATITLPPYAPSGKTFISVMALTKDAENFVDVVNSQYNDERLIPIEINRPNEQINVEEHPVTQLGDINGQRGFKVGETFKLPFFNRFIGTCDFERIHDIKDNRIDIQYFWMYSSCIRPGTENDDFITWIDQQITSTLRVRPNCYFMIGMDLRVTREWLAENQSEMMLDYTGKTIDQKGVPDRLVSLGSKKYLQDCYDFIDKVIDFFNRQPYAGRIIGYYPYACTHQDAFIGGAHVNRNVTDRNKIYIGDFHPGVIEQFRAWLKQKYFSVDQLQKAWNDTSVTFENALPNGKALAGEDFDNGVFRDPVKSRSSIDYITFFPTVIGGFYQKIAAHYKERTKNHALVFMNYGATLATLSMLQPSGVRAQSSNNDFYNLLNDPNIDMFVQSQPYDVRNIDDPLVTYQAIESINLHNKMYMFDYDARTISSGTLRYGRHRSQYESEAILKRDFGWILQKNGGAWLADMSTCNWRNWEEKRKPWFSTPEVTTPTRQTLAVFQKAADIPKKSVAEIAVVLDIDTPAYEDILNAGVIYRGLSTRFARGELTKLGAPYDIILKPDLQQGKARDDYKLYFFINPFYLSEKDREMINALKRDGKTLVWFYAPGYISDKGLDVSGVSDITGINVQIKPDVKELLQMTVQASSSPLAADLHNVLFKADIWQSLEAIHPDVIQPVFYIDDPDATNLAIYPDGKSAWAVKKFDNWNSIYSAVPFINIQAVRNIAKFAGVHLYVDEDIVMGADNRFLMFANGYAKKRTLTVNLPNAATVKDAFTGEVVAKEKSQFPLTMDSPETRILRIVD
jgi:hypothetical protein